MKTYITVKIEKLIFGGQGLGRLDNKVVLVWNALPGEEVKAFIIRKRKNLIEAIAEEIITPSPHRIESKEEHFLSCSPWQTMTWEQEQFWKNEIVKETFKRVGKFEAKEIEIVGDEQTMYGYRNKMEHSFRDVEGKLHLAAFKRGSQFLQQIDTCLLSDEVIRETEQEVLGYLRIKKKTAEVLKTVMVRSNGKGQTIVGLFVKERNATDWEDLAILLNARTLGVQVYYSDPHSPASIPTKLLKEVGQPFLQATVLNTPLDFGLMSFFQINIPVFERALQDMMPFLDKNTDLLDFYSGVGAISLTLKDYYRHAILVEGVPQAVEYAKKNANRLGLSKQKADCICAPAEEMLKFITHDKIVVFDPPRPGLHQKVITQVLKELPKRIIYLSCDVATQSRDIGLLQEKYNIVFTRVYNFFPRTPHIESLCILERK